MARKITDEAANRIGIMALELTDPHTGTPHPDIGKLLAEQVLKDLPPSAAIKRLHERNKKDAGRHTEQDQTND